MKIEFSINPRKIAVILALISSLLVILSLISEYIVETVMGGDSNTLLGLVLDLFSVNLETSIPTWFSVLILFFAAVLIAIIAISKLQTQSEYRIHWAALAIIFVYLSMDEGAAIHEIMANVTQSAFSPVGFFYFGWQIVAIPLVIIFALTYLRFLFHLPSHIAVLFFLSAATFVGGALIVEGISANQWYVDNGLTMTYLAIGTIEEWCEMLGVTLFIYTLLRYIVEEDISVSIAHSLSSGKNNQTVIVTPKSMPIQATNLLSKIRPSLLIIFFLMGLSLFMFSIILQNTQTNTVYSTNRSFYASISDELKQNDVLVLEMNHALTLNNFESLQMADALLSQFDDVLIVTFPTKSRSVVFAGQKLPVDSNRLTDLLDANGDVEYIIFDTTLLKTLVGTMPSANSE